MKGLLTPRQLKRIEQEHYDLYEVMVAKHIWHVIKRNLNSHHECYSATIVVQHTKVQMCNRYNVRWLLDCLLCDLYRDDESCGECPLVTCSDYDSPYVEALNGSIEACDEIIEVIDEDACKRGVLRSSLCL